jgi:hypothetical protein
MGEQNEPNFGRTRIKNKADSVRIDTRGSTGATAIGKPYDSMNRGHAPGRRSASPAQAMPANSPETDNQSERSDMNEDTVVQTWGMSLQHVALTLQLADAAIRGLGDPELHYEDMDLLRKGVLELAVHLGATPALSISTPPEASLGSLIQTNAEQAKALAQNANSIATLTRILESQPTATATQPMGMLSGLSESIHALVKWTSHLKCSDNLHPIKPSPKKKASTAPEKCLEWNHIRGTGIDSVSYKSTK